MTTILYAGAVLGVLGIVFGLVLNFAGKKFHVEVDERIEKVRACLGGANCGACGYPGCDGFAEAVVRGDAKPNGCAPAGEKGAAEIARIMGVEAQPTERLVARVLCQGRDGIAISRYNYDGYRSCIVAAGIAGGPKSCRFACIGLGDCMDHCAFGAIMCRMTSGRSAAIFIPRRETSFTTALSSSSSVSWASGITSGKSPMTGGTPP